MVDYVDDPLALERDINAFVYSSDCPEDLRTKMTSIPGSLADKVTTGARILYAHYDELNDAGKTAMAQVFEHAINKNWSTYAAENDAQTIVDYVEREFGDQGAISPPSDLTEWPKPDAALRDGFDWRQPVPDDPEEPAED